MRFLNFMMPMIIAATCSADTSIFPFSEVKAGMKGQGRTVFKGSKIERFEFEVLGIQKNSAPGRNRILVRVWGGPLAETAVPAGISGSPCYIDGKLVGALSSGFLFEKEPIGGITPIEEMLSQLKDLPETPGIRSPLILPKLDSPKVLKSALQGEMIPLSELLEGQGLSKMRPLLVAGSEFSPESLQCFHQTPFQFVAMAGAGQGGREEGSPIEPGGMVAIPLVQGDLNLSVSGTITHVQGKRLMLFGHEMFNLGGIEAPLWSANVATVVPSYMSSFKLATPVAPVGAVRLDRPSGVLAVQGAEARMIPLRIGLNLGGKKQFNYKFELMEHPFLSPFLASIVMNQSLTSHIRGLGLQSLSLQGNIKLVGHPPIQIENFVADLNPQRMAAYVGGLLQAVLLNPFEAPTIEGISLTVKGDERVELTGVSGLRLLKAKVKRGESLPILVQLQNFQGVRETASFNLPIPLSARKGKATLLVGDGYSLTAQDPDERVIDVGSLQDIIRILNGAMRNNHAYAVLIQSQPGAGLRGSRIEAIPPTIAGLLNADPAGSDNKLQRRVLAKSIIPLEREVRGFQSLDVEIE